MTSIVQYFQLEAGDGKSVQNPNESPSKFHKVCSVALLLAALVNFVNQKLTNLDRLVLVHCECGMVPFVFVSVRFVHIILYSNR